MFESGGGGVQKEWGVWGYSHRRKKSEFQILVPKMAYFDWNMENIFIYFANKGGEISPLRCWVSGPDPSPPGGNPVYLLVIWNLKQNVWPSLRIYVGYVILTLSGYFILYFKHYSCNETW